MRRLLLTILLVLAAVSIGSVVKAASAQSSGEPSAHKAFVQGIQAYQNDDYTAAAEFLEQAAAAGIANGRLYYNLGNAFLKADDLGRAILWYERARRFLPKDPELDFNLNYARSLRRDAPGEAQSPLSKVMFFWRENLSPRWLQMACLAAAWLALLGLGLNLFRSHRAFRGAALAGALALLALLPSAAYDWHDVVYGGRAVVLAEKLAVRSGLNEGATELFSLHAGTEVRIEDRREGYVRIRYAKDRLGWVEASSVAALWPVEISPDGLDDSKRSG